MLDVDAKVPATVVLIGVADSVGELIREHGSVERALVQIQMPRMSIRSSARFSRRHRTGNRVDVSTSDNRSENLLRVTLPSWKRAVSAFKRAGADVMAGEAPRISPE